MVLINNYTNAMKASRNLSAWLLSSFTFKKCSELFLHHDSQMYVHLRKYNLPKLYAILFTQNWRCKNTQIEMLCQKVPVYIVLIQLWICSTISFPCILLWCNGPILKILSPWWPVRWPEGHYDMRPYHLLGLYKATRHHCRHASQTHF